MIPIKGLKYILFFGFIGFLFFKKYIALAAILFISYFLFKIIPFKKMIIKYKLFKLKITNNNIKKSFIKERYKNKIKYGDEL